MKETSIQISVKHRNMLKKYCEVNGYNMSSFVEKLIERASSPNPPSPLCFDGIIMPVRGSTPFGIYDDDETFCKDCSVTALWVARRLGYPVISIELNISQLYSAFEESVSTYNSLTRTFNTYATINSNGKYWIRCYCLAICKELLGMIRMKYQCIPVPGGSVEMDGVELRNEARVEKDILRADLIIKLP